MHRNHTRQIHIGDRMIGGGSPILIQSMTNTKTEDAASTVAQIRALEAVGCDIVRVAVPTMAAAAAISEIKKQISIPLVADIHFDYRLAIAAIENGADKIRINPGNISTPLAAVVHAAKARHIPIRVGVNSGSLEKHLLQKYGTVTAPALVESALGQLRLIEALGYENIVVSIKSSDVMMSVAAHEQIAARCDYPLHVGITEAGGLLHGSVKSAVGLSLILNQGIGDTIRVSLTGDPLEEIKAAKTILRTLGLRGGGIELISCPTCGRTGIDLAALAEKVEALIAEIEGGLGHGHAPSRPTLKVAVMGCAVNGPGEAREADVGIAAGLGEGLLFRKGQIIKKLPETELLAALRTEIYQAIKP